MQPLQVFHVVLSAALAACVPSVTPNGPLGAEQETRLEGVIGGAELRKELGFCYIFAGPFAAKPDRSGAEESSLRLFEDGKEIGPPHTAHQVIRERGAGAFSHWSGTPSGKSQTLYFSASDNTDPRTNGRTYKWALIRNKAGQPMPYHPVSLRGEPCRLKAVPDQPLDRDRHTTLLAHFDEADRNDATFARVQRSEVGRGSNPNAPGRFAGGVSVEGSNGAVQFPGLDNYNPLVGTVEFWAQSRASQPVWSDGKAHWILVLYPERAEAGPRHGMSPYFVTLTKSEKNALDLRVANRSYPPYAAAVGLGEPSEPTLSVSVRSLSPREWHHILLSWDLRGSGHLWLLVDGVGVGADMRLPATRPAPNPGGAVVFGGFWGLPGDGVRNSDCNLDELRVQDDTVAARLRGASSSVPNRGIDELRVLSETDLSRAMLDRLLQLQFRGGWAAAYHWPTYTPSGWGLVGRGVDMWFANSAEAASALLRGWLLWSDDRYLDAAIEAADMFCKTQMANGSWAAQYSYSRGEFVPVNTSACIAQAMQSNQIRFLCLMYRRLGYERYGKAIRAAGDWMASIQFANGAWAWEGYPLDQKGPLGHAALNDAVTPQAMWDLFVIWCATGDRRYLDSAMRGAGWIVDVQAKAPTFGWADQYDDKNQFAWMRNFEPPAVSMQAIRAATWGLGLAYDLTGDRSYLDPLRRTLQWMDSVPEAQRGWLWYDPKTSTPVVAYHNEMLPVGHPRAIKDIIPRLDAHYGSKQPWAADSIRAMLTLREQGPAYPDWRGGRPRREFGKVPTADEFAARFHGDPAREAREQLAAWVAGRPLPGILGGAPEFGRTFEVGNAIRYCETLITDIEDASVALGDLPASRIPRFGRGSASDWTYMDPPRDFFASPMPGGFSP